MRVTPILILSLGLMILLCGCTQAPSSSGTVTPAVTTPTSVIANPAAVFCTQKGYGYEIRKNTDGSEYGVCILPGGTECEEWAYYRGTCNESTEK